MLASPSRARAEEQRRPQQCWCITCLQILLLSAACRARNFSFVVALSRVFCSPGSKVSEQKTIRSTESEVARKYNYCVGPCKGSLWSLSPRYATEKGKLFYRGSWIVLAQQGKVHYKSKAKALQMTTPVRQISARLPWLQEEAGQVAGHRKSFKTAFFFFFSFSLSSILFHFKC